MKLLLLTQYFPPETGAPQNRLYDLAIRLGKKGVDVTVLTALPNYPNMEIFPSFRGKWRDYSEKDGLKIFRSWIFVRKRGTVFSRLLTYFSFVFSSLFTGLFRIREADIILCESPPLFLGITAYILKKKFKAKLVFNVSDLWPESAAKLGLVTNPFLLSLSARLEEFMYKKSSLVSGQTQGIIKNISQRFPGVKTHWLPNGVSLDFYDGNPAGNWRKENGFSEQDFLLLYAGIVGHAQGLEVILDAALQLKEFLDVKWLIAGNGPLKEGLMLEKNRKGLNSVLFFDVISKEKMPALISAADAAVVPLRKLELFKGAIPSKLFENLAMKKPVLLGVDGEARELFINQGKTGLFFDPENGNELARQALILYKNRELCRELGENGSRYVREHFNRENIAEDFRKILTSL